MPSGAGIEEEEPIPQVDESDGSANSFGRQTSQIAIAQLLQLSGFAASESGALNTLSDMVWFYTGQLAMLAKDRAEHCNSLCFGSPPPTPPPSLWAHAGLLLLLLLLSLARSTFIASPLVSFSPPRLVCCLAPLSHLHNAYICLPLLLSGAAVSPA